MLDDEAADMVRATTSVTYRPHESTQWLVEFGVVLLPGISGRAQISITAEHWADPGGGSIVTEKEARLHEQHNFAKGDFVGFDPGNVS